MSDTVRLLESARAGDPLAFDELFARHRSRLTTYVAVRLGPAMRAQIEPDDLVQEAYLEAHRKLGAFEPRGPSAFYRWLVTIAGFKLKEAIRHGQAKKREGAVRLPTEAPAEQTSVGGRVVREEGVRELAAWIDGLPEAQGTAVRMRYLEGHTVAETAEEMGRSAAAIKSLVARGLGGLAERVAAG